MSSDFVFWSLGDLLNAGFDEGYLVDRFGAFACTKEPGVAEYLFDRSIDDERNHRARTYLFLDTSAMKHAEVIVAGMFTLAFTVLFEGDPETPLRDCALEPAFLLLQFGRSDEYEDRLTGKEMMFEAESRVRQASEALGGACFFLDCKESAAGLIKSYEDKGFAVLPGAGSGDGLVRMVKNLYASPDA